MNFRQCLFTRWQKVIVLLVATTCVATTLTPARAEPSATEQLRALDTSLNLIPEDAAFYSSMLRNREQIDAIAHSRAWAKLQQMPAVQMVQQMIQQQIASPGSKAAKVKMYLDSPMAQRFLGLLADMFSNDVFIYGDADMADTLQLMQEVAAVMRYGPPMLQITGQMENLDGDEIQAALLIAALAENVDHVKVPGMVFGFKVEDTARAIEHIGKFEAILTLALASQSPELAETLQHAKVNGTDYLVLTLKGSMVPWDRIPLEKIKRRELQQGSVDKLVAKLKKEKLVIAIGVRGDYLLVSIGSSTDPLAKLAKGAGLVSRPEMVPLARFADRRLVAIDYVNKEFMEAANGGQRQIDDMLDFVEQILPSLKLTEDQQAQIRGDAKELARAIQERMPVIGAISQVSFLSEQGIESFRYDWSTHPGLDGSKKLGLLSHVGGSPILAVVSRGKVSLEDYDLAVKWLAKGYAYFREYGLPNMSAGDRQQFEKLAEAAEPILARINRINRQKLLPALDGQFALVVDGKLTSKQFLTTLPPTKQAMPMIEPAILLGVRDADLMRDALVDYWNAIHEIWNTAAEFNPELADVSLPEPETVDTAYGELFVFTPPDECPIDKQITPNVGLGTDVCVFSMSQSHAQRLLKATPLSVGGVLGDTDRPMAVAVVFDWAGLLRAGRPWVEMAVEKILQEKHGAGMPEAQAEAIKKQVLTVMELLSVIRCVTSEAHLDNGAMVVHTIVEIRDVD